MLLDLKKKLAALLIEKSYMEGDFTLSSGLKSDYYFDCRQTSLHPDGAWLIGSIMAEMIKDMDIQGVGGMTMGADPLITAVSLAGRERGFAWPGLIVRKEAKKHGTGNNLEGMANFSAGAKIVLLEDVVSTAGSVIKALASVRAAGLQVDEVVCVLDREMGGREALAQHSCSLRTIFTRPELVSFSKA